MSKHCNVFIVFSILLWMCSCGQQAQEEVDTPSFTYDRIDPVDFPDLGIPGFQFPRDSSVINQWITDGEMDSIFFHGWGIWKGLTSPTSQSSGGEQLLVFETWLTPSEIIDSIQEGSTKRSGRANLQMPNQLVHASEKTGQSPDSSTFESVSYSPAAATFALDNKIFMATTLAKYMNEGMTDIPAFPNNAITLKPVFKLIHKDHLNEDGLFVMPSWHGPISTESAYPQSQWNSCIYIDLKNNGQGDGSQDMGCQGPTPQTTYNLTDFIHYSLNEEDIYYFNKEFSFGDSAQVGDIAILVAMHVSTRETTRWTWQTFWWAPNPDAPPLPSSPEIASIRSQLKLSGAAAHYAMATAYYMVNPNEPEYSQGAKITGDTIIGFNPYLEAGFGPGVFTGSNSVVYRPDGQEIPTAAGVRTNCMSCHVYAAYDPFNPDKGTPYSGNAYVSMDDPIFKGMIRLDFAFSISNNIDTTGMKAYVASLNGK